ncbi:hypothetical protein AKO1_015342 [Acrasis kona]|uniref:Tetratricopeptide repeat protein n=1 Tax=Acrasis kona TaxID=1008807 RepID=A0AAW2ZHI7_9EUKA
MNSHEEAIIAVKNKELTKALLCYGKSIFLEPNNSDWYKARAEIFFLLGDVKSAVSNYKKAISLNEENKEWRERLSELLDAQSLVFYRERQYSAAIICLTNALEYVIDEKLNFHRAVNYVSLGDVSKAMSDLEYCNTAKCIPFNFILRGQVHLSLKFDLIAAKSDVEMASREHSQNDSVKKFIKQYHLAIQEKRRHGDELMSQGNYKEAIDVFSLIIQLYPNDTQSYLQRSICKRGLSAYAAAIQDLYSVINLSGGTDQEAEKLIGMTFYDIAEGYCSAHHDELAIKHLTQAIKWLKIPQFYIKRGDCFHNLKKHEKSLKDYRRARKLGGDDDDVSKMRLAMLHNEWGKLLFEQQEYEKSEQEFTKAIQIYHKNPKLSKARFQTKQFVGALEDTAVAYMFDPKNDEVINTLSQYSPKLLQDRNDLIIVLKRVGISDKDIREALDGGNKESLDFTQVQSTSKAYEKQQLPIISRSHSAVPSIRDQKSKVENHRSGSAMGTTNTRSSYMFHDQHKIKKRVDEKRFDEKQLRDQLNMIRSLKIEKPNKHVNSKK